MPADGVRDRRCRWTGRRIGRRCARRSGRGTGGATVVRVQPAAGPGGGLVCQELLKQREIRAALAAEDSDVTGGTRPRRARRPDGRWLSTTLSAKRLCDSRRRCSSRERRRTRGTRRWRTRPCGRSRIAGRLGRLLLAGRFHGERLSVAAHALRRDQGRIGGPSAGSGPWARRLLPRHQDDGEDDHARSRPSATSEDAAEARRAAGGVDRESCLAGQAVRCRLSGRLWVRHADLL